MVIDVPEDLCLSIEGTRFFAAPSVAELHALLGPPSRVAEPAVRAPVGHRNNLWHVYDTAGVYFNEHHYTRRITGCSIVLQPEEEMVPVEMPQPFTGSLRLGGREVLPQAGLLEMLRGCQITFKPFFKGWLTAQRGDFSVVLVCNGIKLASGHRSEKLGLVSVALSWPHDPWGAPAC
jgi:hypothetical protein